jgi:pimeloyl-ACP methyl ester carboxylesterase
MKNDCYRTRRVKAGRHHIAVHEMGSGSPIVLVHGLMGCAGTWQGVAERLVAASYRVVMPELIGFGQSDRTTDIESLWLESQADALLTALVPDLAAGAVFVGHDYGGPTVVTLYRRAPHLVHAMLLMSCNLTADTSIPFPLSAWSWPLVGNLMRRAVLSRFSMAMTLRLAVANPIAPPIESHLGDDLQLSATKRIFRHAILELSDRYRAVHDTLATIDVPTMILWGDRDPFFPLAEGRRMAAAIPGADFGVLSRCGHFAAQERPAEVAAAILKLARNAESAAAGNP